MDMKKTRRKALGQHFLIHKKTLLRIVAVISPVPEDFIVEIGAGKGALTRLLANSGAKIIALEKDALLIPYLKKHESSRLTVLETDALKNKFRDILQGKQGKIVGNLPYSISTPLLFKVLDEKEVVTSCVFLLQKEVAQRACASPGTKKFAPLSILLQNDFHAHLHFHVPATAFSPPPKVTSSLISLLKRSHPISPVPLQKGFATFLKSAFQSRRKKLANNLRALDFSPDIIKKSYLECGIDENWRPEQVSLPQFVTLYACLFGDKGTR